jgi:hypothetical protein
MAKRRPSLRFGPWGWWQVVFYRVSATRARPPVGPLLSGRGLRVLTLACLLLAGCASPGGLPSQQASDQGSPPTADPNSPDAVKARVEASEKALSPAYLQRRRQAIAELLEKNVGYDNNFHVKLMEAQLAGPKVAKHREWYNWLKPTTEVNAIYCAKAQLDSPLELYPRRTAVIVVKNAGNGAETLQANVAVNGYIGVNAVPPICHGMEGYEPFPELEQARARRRQALGKTD